MTANLSNDQNAGSPNESSQFAEAIRFLENRINFEKLHSFSVDDLGRRLDELHRILDYLGNPEKKLKTIHVAGTKGKGSTCAMLDAVLQESGYRVGRFTSPHLYSVRERFLINGAACTETELVRLLLELRDKIAAFSADLIDRLTYFELITLVAFVYFAEQQVDVAILEVGMGGRLDATNVCDPCLTLISSISFDHMQQLGPTLADIAEEKGGIIKPGVPLISSVKDLEPKAALQSIAQTSRAPAYFLEDAFRIRPSDSQPSQSLRPEQQTGVFCFQTVESEFPEPANIEGLRTAFPGKHQEENASLVVAAALLLRKAEALSIRDEDIRQGLLKAFLPIRIEIMRPQTEKGPVFVVDGAHNRASVKAFMETVQTELPSRRYTVLFGTSLGKDIEGMLEELIPNVQRIVFTQYSINPRFFPSKGLKTICCSQFEILNGIQFNFWLCSQQAEENELFFAVHADKSTTKKEQRFIEIDVEENALKALERIWKEAEEHDVVCVTGSMFLAAELREFFLHHLASSGESGKIPGVSDQF